MKQKKPHQHESPIEDHYQEFWSDYARALVHPLEAHGQIGRFVRTPDIVGTYAEALIFKLVRSMLPQYRVSTGTIIGSADRHRRDFSLPQCDIIIWDPSELPAIFECGDFALVPKLSTRGIIEVKRSCRTIGELDAQLSVQQQRLHPQVQNNILGVVIGHPRPLFDDKLSTDWLAKRRGPAAKTRIFRKKLARATSFSLDDLDVDGFFVLVYFLSQLAGRSSPLPSGPSGAR